ncbi:MAG: NAD(P)-binding Rossmann-like domain [Symbiobacteriaceae bacterium]|jgi:cation diffusion facilitator CzcD-associated flavoprotein CzcO|nr:NAD(P)-binding Rossmann-like domain [Symbiobacteriaceae bacterium]
MRAAIVGAGLAGLACAHELERLGHDCEIFDKRDRVGKMFNTVVVGR